MMSRSDDWVVAVVLVGFRRQQSGPCEWVSLAMTLIDAGGLASPLHHARHPARSSSSSRPPQTFTRTSVSACLKQHSSCMLLLLKDHRAGSGHLHSLGVISCPYEEGRRNCIISSTYGRPRKA